MNSLQITLTILSLTPCQSTLTEIATMLETPTAENSTSPDQRKIGGLWSHWLENLNQYGCWCYFNADFGKGKSKPVDDLDVACKALHNGYECVEIDSLVEGEVCTSWDQSYLAISHTNLHTDAEIVEACEVSVGATNCASRACAVETKFVKFLSDWASIHTPDYAQFSAQSGNFDPSDSCPVSGTGNRIGEKQCCGNFPSRFPYWTSSSSGSRGCCNGATFDSQLKQCCLDGSVDFSC